MAAAIIEFDALADPVGSAAEDDDLLLVRWRGFVGRVAGKRRFVGRIHVSRRRSEFGGAGVDALEDRPHAKLAAALRNLFGGKPGELAEPRIGKSHRFEPAQRRRRRRQALAADFGFHLDDAADLGQEPRIDMAGIVDVGIAHAEPHRLRHFQQAVRRRRAERGADGVLVVALIEARDGDLIKTGQSGFQRAQRFLQAFRECAADRHRLADRFHRGGEHRFGAGKFLEGKARHLGDDVIDGRLERGRRGAAGDVVGDLVERVADRELCRDFGDGETGRFRSERRGPRHPRIHLDDDQAAVGRIDRELHIGAAGLDADLAQHRDRGVAHDLIFLVGERQRRRYGDGIAGMHAHRIDVFDRADDDAIVVLVAHHLHLEFFPAEHRFLDQHFAGRRGVDAAFDDLDELRLVVGDAAAGAAERERRPDDGGQPDIFERLERLDERLDLVRARRRQPDLGHRLAKQLAVFGLVDGVGGGADHLDVELVQHAHLAQRQRGVERGLPAHRRQQRVGAFLLDDLGDHLRRDRLDIGRIRQIRIGHDRRRIGIDEDDPIALGLERLAGLRAGIVEFARLADDDRARANNQDRGDVGPSGHRFRMWDTKKGRARCASFGPAPGLGPARGRLRPDSTGREGRAPFGARSRWKAAD